MVKGFFVSCLYAIFLSVGAAGMTWQEILKISEQNSADIKSAEKELQSSQWTYYKSYSNFLPQVSANMSTSQSLYPSNTTRSYSYGISATQYLFRGFSNYFNMQLAYLGYLYDSVGLENAKSSFFYNLRSAFIAMLTAQENIEVQKKILKSRRDNSRMITLLYDSGKEDKGNYLRTLAQLKDAEYSLSSASRDYSLAKFKLFQLAGVDVATVEESFTVKAENNLDLESLVISSPAFLMVKYQLEMSEINYKSTIGEFLPSISLSGNYLKSDTEWPPQNSNKSLKLSLSYPFFPGGSNIADAVVNASNYDKAKEDFAKTKRDLVYSIKNAHESLKDALESYTVQKIFLNAAMERSKISQAQYLNGLITYDEWDRIQTEYVSYQRSVLSARRSALLAQAALFNLYGGHVK